MLISVCIPAYNQGKYLEQCIKSLIQQSVQPDEIIVSNDASTDNTKEILDRLSAEIPTLKVIHQEVNLGLSGNTNFCLRSAKNEFVVRVDSDDYLLPKYLETLSSLLTKYSDAGYAHAAVQEIDQFGNKTKVRKLYRKEEYQSSDAALKAACNGYKVAANILMFRKSALEAAGYITTRVNFAEDFYLSVEIANAGFGNVYSDEILSCYRWWTDEGNVRQKRKLNEIDGIRIVFDEPIKNSFVKRGWSLKILEQKKKAFACAQSNCLMWDVYNKDEKAELETAIYNLSPAIKVKAYAFLYKNGLGDIVEFPASIIHNTKQVVKNLILRN